MTESMFKIHLISATKVVGGEFHLESRPTVFDLLPIAKCFEKAINSLFKDSEKQANIVIFGEEIEIDRNIFQAICIQCTEVNDSQRDMISNQFYEIRHQIIESINNLPATIDKLLKISFNIPAKTRILASQTREHSKNIYFVKNSFEGILLNDSRKIMALKKIGELSIFNSDFGSLKIPLNKIASKLTEVSDDSVAISGYVSGMVDDHREMYLTPKSGKSIKIQMQDAYAKHRDTLDLSHHGKRITDVNVKKTHEYCAGEPTPKSFEFESLKLTKKVHLVQGELDIEK